jgi:hypothetical protein
VRLATLAAVWQRRLAVAALCGALLAACGNPAAPRRRFTYGPTPSVSARMICRQVTIHAFARVLGVATTSHPSPTWANHRYTCAYRYPRGTMVLYVQELPTLSGTRAFMTSLGRSMGDAGPVANVGQGAFATPNGSVVSRKDNKVLVVNVAGLPRTFGHPATARGEVALTVTELIFACWRGD